MWLPSSQVASLSKPLRPMMYSTRDETDYQDLSFDATRRLGYNWDNYAPDWQRAVNAAKGVYTGGVNNLDDAYYLGRGLRNDWLGGVTLELNPSDARWGDRVNVSFSLPVCLEVMAGGVSKATRWNTSRN